MDLCEPKGCSAIYIACDKEHLAIVKELIKAGADLNRIRPDNPLPLHWMASRGNIEVIIMQFVLGADSGVQGGEGVGGYRYGALYCRFSGNQRSKVLPPICTCLAPCLPLTKHGLRYST